MCIHATQVKALSIILTINKLNLVNKRLNDLSSNCKNFCVLKGACMHSMYEIKLIQQRMAVFLVRHNVTHQCRVDEFANA